MLPRKEQWKNKAGACIRVIRASRNESHHASDCCDCWWQEAWPLPGRTQLSKWTTPVVSMHKVPLRSSSQHFQIFLFPFLPGLAVEAASTHAVQGLHHWASPRPVLSIFYSALCHGVDMYDIDPQDTAQYMKASPLQKNYQTYKF